MLRILAPGVRPPSERSARQIAEPVEPRHEVTGHFGVPPAHEMATVHEDVFSLSVPEAHRWQQIPALDGEFRAHLAEILLRAFLQEIRLDLPSNREEDDPELRAVQRRLVANSAYVRRDPGPARGLEREAEIVPRVVEDGIHLVPRWRVGDPRGRGKRPPRREARPEGLVLGPIQLLSPDAHLSEP